VTCIDTRFASVTKGDLGPTWVHSGFGGLCGVLVRLRRWRPAGRRLRAGASRYPRWSRGSCVRVCCWRRPSGRVSPIT